MRFMRLSEAIRHTRNEVDDLELIGRRFRMTDKEMEAVEATRKYPEPAGAAAFLGVSIAALASRIRRLGARTYPITQIPSVRHKIQQKREKLDGEKQEWEVVGSSCGRPQRKLLKI